MLRQHFNLGTGTFFGGKGASGVAHSIINQIPFHITFVSGFLGRCAITRYKRPAARSIGYEIDPKVYNKWMRVLSDVIELHNADFLQSGLQMPELQSPNTFLYLDPPYLIETRSSHNRYDYELDEAQHRMLLEAAMQLPCMVAISCYDSELYKTALKGWRKISFPAQTRGGVRIETLYMNYPEPTPDLLHDKAFLGRNFRVREKANRRIKTIKSKITRLEPEEFAQLSIWLEDLVTSRDSAMLEPSEVSHKRAIPAGP